MATKSILKTIEIKDKKLGNDFANALEYAYEQSANNTKEVLSIKRECVELSDDEVKNFFDGLI